MNARECQELIRQGSLPREWAHVEKWERAREDDQLWYYIELLWVIGKTHDLYVDPVNFQQSILDVRAPWLATKRSRFFSSFMAFEAFDESPIARAVTVSWLPRVTERDIQELNDYGGAMLEAARRAEILKDRYTMVARFRQTGKSVSTMNNLMRDY